MRLFTLLLAVLLPYPALAFDASKFGSPTYDTPNVDTLIIRSEGSSGPASGLTAKPSGLGGVARTLGDLISDFGTPKSFGADCTGNLDAALAVSRAATAFGEVRMPANCNLRFATSTTIDVPVYGRAGSTLGADNVTVTFNGGFTGPLSRQFLVGGVSGKFTMLPTKQPEVFPEWWKDPANGDWIPALNAAVESGCRRVRLQLADYVIGTTWKINKSGLVVQGQEVRNKVPGVSTRLIIVGGATTGVQLGPDTMPAGGINNFNVDLTFRDITIVRNQTPTTYTTGDKSNLAVGLKAQYLLDSKVERIYATEHNVGFRVHGMVYSQFNDNVAFKSTKNSPGADPAPASDYFWGWFLDGTYEPGLAAGGNASLYLNRNGSNLGVAGGLGANSIGLNIANQGFVDTFVDKFEATSVFDGVLVTGAFGSGATTSPPVYQGLNADLHLNRIIVDGFTGSGITFTNINEFGAVRLTGSYFGQSGAASVLAGIRVDRSFGMLVVDGNQVICWVNTLAGQNAFGIYATLSQMIQAVNNKLLGCARPEAYVGVNFSELANLMMNPAGHPPTEQPTFVSGSNRNIFRPSASGSANGYPSAIFLDSTSTYNEVNPTKVDPRAYPIKLNYDGKHTTSRTFGTGNVQTGVLD